MIKAANNNIGLPIVLWSFRLKNIKVAFFLLFSVFSISIPNALSHEVKPIEKTFLLTASEKVWLKKHPKISVAFDKNFPPYSYLDDEHHIIGVAVDYFKLIEKKLGIKFNFIGTMNWEKLYDKAISGNRGVDVVATMVKRKNRISYFNFTSPYIFKSLVVITKLSSRKINKRADLANKTIALVEKYQYTAKILKQFPSIVPYYVSSIRDALGAVKVGKADGMIGFITVADWYRKKYLWENLHIAAVYDRNSANESIAVRKDWPILAAILQKILSSISVEEKNTIIKKWLPSISSHTNYQRLLKEFFIISVAALFLLGSVFYLKNKNQKIQQAEKLANESNQKLITLSNNLEHQVKERTEKLFQLSYYDKLTQLGNKNLFFKKVKAQINQSMVEQRSFALICLDIDRFKYINDTLGHKIGNDIIKQIAQRITENRFSNDVVTRFGGDEFNLLLVDISIEDTFDVIHTLLTYLKQPYLVHDKPINLTVSAGIAMFPQDGATVSSLMQRGDQAMYKAKDEKTGFEFSNSNVVKNFSDHLQLEQALLQAINELLDEHKKTPFKLYYQPVKWLNKKGLKGFEALIRWQHGTLGWVSPEKFISLAEEIGKVDIIGHWVRETAFKQARKWYDADMKFGRVSINLSPIELQNPKLISLLKEEITKSGARFEWIEIEITETAILKNPVIALNMINEIKKLGVTISIDDFGTGYSSLVYLKQIPADTVKIDREFVKNLPYDHEDIVIDKSIIELCHGLNKIITAEGVETIEQLVSLKQLGCDSIQGYYISKPIPAELIHKTSSFFEDLIVDIERVNSL